MSTRAVTESKRSLENAVVLLRSAMRLACVVLVGTSSLEEKLTIAKEVWAIARAMSALDERIRRLTPMPILEVVEGHMATGANSEGTRPRIQFTEHLTAHLRDHSYPEVWFSLEDALRDVVMRHDVESADRIRQALDLLQFDGIEGFKDPQPCDCDEGVGVAMGEYQIPDRPGRPPDLREAEPGAKPVGLLGQLHDFAFRIELCAAEACAATIASSPSAPLGLHFDLALQLRDEMRHFELFTEHLRSRGSELLEYEIRFEVWDRFRCASTLPEQLLIEQRVGEGAALDSAESVYSRLVSDGELELATMFEYVTADEVQHVKNGNCWLLVLLGSEDEVLDAEHNVRKLLETQGLAEPMKPLSASMRRSAGFSEREMDVIEAWRTAREA